MSISQIVVAVSAGLLLIVAIAAAVVFRLRHARQLESDLKKDFKSLTEWWTWVFGDNLGDVCDTNICYLAEREKWPTERIFATAKARYAYERADAYLNGHMYMFWRPFWQLKVAELLLEHAAYLLKFKEVSWDKIVFLDRVKDKGVIATLQELKDRSGKDYVLLRPDGMIPIDGLNLEIEIHDAGFQVASVPVNCTEVGPDELCLVVANKELILWPRRRAA